MNIVGVKVYCSTFHSSFVLIFVPHANKVGCSDWSYVAMYLYIVFIVAVSSNVNEALNDKVLERCKDKLLEKVLSSTRF